MAQIKRARRINSRDCCCTACHANAHAVPGSHHRKCPKLRPVEGGKVLFPAKGVWL
jgi:hypothetical protein